MEAKNILQRGTGQFMEGKKIFCTERQFMEGK